MATIRIYKDTQLVWAHNPSDRLQFISGRFSITIDGTVFRAYSKSGRVYGEWNVGDVTVIDQTNGNAEFNYPNTLNGAIQLSGKLISMEYPGISRIVSGGGGGSDMYVNTFTYSGSPITVPSGLTNMFVFNRNAFQDTVTFTYSGTSVTINSGAIDNDELLIIAKNAE